MGDLTAFHLADAFVAGRGGAPDAVAGVQADAVGYCTIRQFGPYTLVAQAAVGGDIECAQTAAEAFADNQRRAVGGDDGTVWKHHIVIFDVDTAVRINANELRRAGFAALVQIEAEVAHVGAALGVDDHVVAVPAGVAAEVGMQSQARAVETE